jgi:hypothetical protein
MRECSPLPVARAARRRYHAIAAATQLIRHAHRRIGYTLVDVGCWRYTQGNTGENQHQRSNQKHQQRRYDAKNRAAICRQTIRVVSLTEQSHRCPRESGKTRTVTARRDGAPISSQQLASRRGLSPEEAKKNF